MPPPVRIKLYEGMFLLSTKAAADLPAALEFIKGVLARAEAEVLVLRRHDERKLAYPIHGQKRGMYILSLFKCRGTQVANIERDFNLSEEVIRTLILAADHMGEPEIELLKKEVPLAVDAKSRAPDDRAARPVAKDTAAPKEAAAPEADDIEVPPIDILADPIDGKA